MVAADVGYAFPSAACKPQRHTITAHAIRDNRHGRNGSNLQSMPVEVEATLQRGTDDSANFANTAAGSGAFLVSINPNGTSENASTTGIPLVGSTGVQLTSADVVNGNRLLVYFNKCDGIFQVINHIPATAAAAATE